jgi:hypothetical protein
MTAMRKRWRDGLAAAALGMSALCLLLAAGPDPGRAEEEKKPAEALPADLARVPQNALMLLSVNAAGLWEHEAMREVRKKMPREVGEVSGLVERELGVGPADIERLVVVGTVAQGSEPFLFFIRTKKPDAGKRSGPSWAKPARSRWARRPTSSANGTGP